jgi:myosin heavy subunit
MSFFINHTAARVLYDAHGFRAKNKDELNT